MFSPIYQITITMWIYFTLYLFMLNYFKDVYGVELNIENNSRDTFPFKRAVDGTRGSKYFEIPVDDSLDIYDAYDEPDFTDYRNNIPGEPGLDYPSFTRIPQTSFTCEQGYRGYYADEEAGCQLFHVCDGEFLVSSFLCPVGSTFSQKLLTCDWWNKVDCSATRNFYQVNNQIIISQVDDDEILRKAYEMTSQQSTRNGIKIVNFEDRTNDNINHRLSQVDDLQSGSINQYSEYRNSPSINMRKYPQIKYSSRYSSALDQHDRDIDYYPQPPENKHSSFQIETVGKNYKNDNDEEYNRFLPSYAPTVPTVTTTTRRYYSPTIPSIIHSTPKSEKYDLEFESSDHLYSAKGKRPSTTTVKNAVVSTTGKYKMILPAVTPPTLDTSTPYLSSEFLSTVSNEILNPTVQIENNFFAIPSQLFQPPIDKENETVSMDKSGLITELLTTKFHKSKNHNLIKADGNATDHLRFNEKSTITHPSSEILPPFFHYSNVGQHNTVLRDTPEKLIFNLTTHNNDDDDDGNDTAVAYLDGEQINHERPKDTNTDESSPFQVTVTLKNNEEFHPNEQILKSLIAQQDFSPPGEIHDIEVVKSDDIGKFYNPSMQVNEKFMSKIDSKYSNVDVVMSKNYDIVPRPFSFKLPISTGINVGKNHQSSTVSPSYSLPTTDIESSFIKSNTVTQSSLQIERDNVTMSNKSSSDKSEKSEILQQLVHTLGQPVYKVQGKTIFQIPSHEHSSDVLSEKEEEEEKENPTSEKEDKIQVETELVPSLGFSLNTDEEREKYVEAVLRGLFRDNIVPEVETKPTNISKS